MAKKFDQTPQGKKESYPYPSPFGSHASMVDIEETKRLGDSTMVVCRDESGLYVTCPKRLDDGMADPNRNMWHEDRAKKFNTVAGQVFEIVK